MKAPQSPVLRKAMADPRDALKIMLAAHRADLSPDGLFEVRLTNGSVYRGKVVKHWRR